MEFDSSSELTHEICNQIVHEQIFQLRPKNYKEKYPKWPGMVGIEVEMLMLKSDSIDKPKPLLFEMQGSGGILEQFKTNNFGWRLTENEGAFAISLEENDQFTFEPGGQLEFSSQPYPCLVDVIERLEKVQQSVVAFGNTFGGTPVQLGINPWHTVHEVGLQVDKPRYRAMDQYFNQIGPFGQKMMRQTCGIQVNLDFGANETTMAKRFLAANLLAPYATAIFANSPVVDGKESEFASFRSYVWQNLDPSRTGFPELDNVKRQLNQKACAESYLDHLRNASVIFLEDRNYTVPRHPISFKQWLREGIDGIKPTVKDFYTHLSLQFPEVRPKGFLEIRSIDGQSRRWQVVPAAFYTALLYDDRNLDMVLDLLEADTESTARLWQLSSYGFKDQKIYSLGKKLMETAFENFHRLPDCYQGESTVKMLEDFYLTYTFKRRSPADDLRQIYSENGGINAGNIPYMEA